MNLRSTVVSDESSRKFLGGFVSVCIFVVAAYEFSELVLAGDLMGFAYVGLVAVGSIFIIAILKNWRNGVYFFFFWLLFEDSRGVFLCTGGAALIIVIAFIWGAPWRQREVLRVFRTVQRAALAIALAVVALFFVFPDALLARLRLPSLTLSSQFANPSAPAGNPRLRPR